MYPCRFINTDTFLLIKEKKMRDNRIVDGNEFYNIMAGDSILDLLPDVYKDEFKHDVVNVFETPPKSRRSVKHVVKEWIKNSELEDVYDIKDDAIKLSRFFSRFSRSKLRNDILDRVNGDPIRAAELFLEMLEKVSGSSENISDMIDQINMNGISIPFASEGSGNSDARSIKREMRISELIEKLDIEYKRFSKKDVDYEFSHYPEDDIDIVRLKSFSSRDISNICVMDMSLEDEIFYLKLINGELRQIEYLKIKESPPKEIFMLLDVSGSMELNIDKRYTREEYAVASAICLLKNSLAGGNSVKIVPFSNSPHDEISGSPEEIVKSLLNTRFTGGGTSIDNAIKFVNEKDVNEVIIITDGDDYVSAKPKCAMTTYLVGDVTAKSLEEVSSDFKRVTEIK